MLSTDIDRIQAGVLTTIQLFSTHQNWTPSPVENGGAPSFTCSDGGATFNYIIDGPGHAIVQILSSVASDSLSITDPLNNEAVGVVVWPAVTFVADGEHAESDTIPLVDQPNNPDQDPNNPLVDPSSVGS